MNNVEKPKPVVEKKNEIVQPVVEAVPVVAETTEIPEEKAEEPFESKEELAKEISASLVILQQLEASVEEAVESEDFDKADALQQQIDELQSKISGLKERLIKAHKEVTQQTEEVEDLSKTKEVEVEAGVKEEEVIEE